MGREKPALLLRAASGAFTQRGLGADLEGAGMDQVGQPLLGGLVGGAHELLAQGHPFVLGGPAEPGGLLAPAVQCWTAVRQVAQQAGVIVARHTAASWRAMPSWPSGRRGPWTLLAGFCCAIRLAAVSPQPAGRDDQRDAWSVASRGTGID